MGTKKTGIFYSQRIMEKEYNVAAIENSLIKRLNESNIEIIKTFSDLGYRNLLRPGLNSLISFLINSGKEIDVVAFYSYDYLGRDNKRIHFVLPRIKKYVREIIFIENIADFYKHEKEITNSNLDVIKEVE